MSLPVCACNMDFSYYCSDEQIFLCTQHYKTHSPDHTCYFYYPRLDSLTKDSLIKELNIIKNKAAFYQKSLKEKVQAIYVELEAQYNNAINIIDSVSSKIINLLTLLNQDEAFILSNSLFLKLQEDQTRGLSTIRNSFDMHIHEKALSKSISEFISIYDGLDEVMNETVPMPIPSPQIAEMIDRKYKLIKAATTYHQPSENPDELSEWVSSMNSKRNCENFDTLCLEGSSINDHSLNVIKLLPNIFFLKTVILNTFSSDELKSTAKQAICLCEDIERLQMSRCEIEEESANDISKALQKCENLKELIIDICESGDLVATIIQGVDLTQLTTLVLSTSIIGDEGIFAICQNFPRMFWLKYLYLDGNDFGVQGGMDLACYLKYLTKLVDINVSKNKIGDVVGLIFKTLSMIPTISCIDVSSTHMEVSQQEYFVQYSQRLVNLESITFDMTSDVQFLKKIRAAVPKHSHVYRHNPDQNVRVEFN